MASFNSLPNELLDAIAKAIVDDVRQQDLADLAAFVLTCRRFRSVGAPVLDARAALRHPYLLAFAAFIGNAGLVKRLLRAGMSPNTQFTWSPRPPGPQTRYPLVPSVPSFDGDPTRFFRGVFRVTDRDIYESEAYKSSGCLSLATFCFTASAESRFRVLGYVPEGGLPDYFKNRLPQPLAFPLHFAAGSGGDVDTIRILLAAGALPDAHSHAFCRHLWDRKFMSAPEPPAPRIFAYRTADWTPLHLALCRAHDAAFWMLRKAGAKLIDTLSGYDSLLHHAVELNRRGIADRLLADEVTTPAAANAKDGLGRSLLWIAYGRDNAALVRRLVALGADVDDGYGVGYTPLLDACLYAKPDMAAELLRLGASVEIPFTGARNQMERLSVFEEAGLDLAGVTPLEACGWLVDTPTRTRLFTPRYRELLPRGVGTVDEVGSHGLELVRVLLDAGADMDRAVDRAAREHKMEMLDALMVHSRFVRYWEGHGLGGIIHSMWQCLSCGPDRVDDVSSSVDPQVDSHYADLEASLRKYGLLKAGEDVDWVEEKRRAVAVGYSHP